MITPINLFNQCIIDYNQIKLVSQSPHCYNMWLLLQLYNMWFSHPIATMWFSHPIVMALCIIEDKLITIKLSLLVSHPIVMYCSLALPYLSQGWWRIRGLPRERGVTHIQWRDNNHLCVSGFHTQTVVMPGIHSGYTCVGIPSVLHSANIALQICHSCIISFLLAIETVTHIHTYIHTYTTLPEHTYCSLPPLLLPQQALTVHSHCHPFSSPSKHSQFILIATPSPPPASTHSSFSLPPLLLPQQALTVHFHCRPFSSPSKHSQFILIATPSPPPASTHSSFSLPPLLLPQQAQCLMTHKLQDYLKVEVNQIKGRQLS